jgi:hypothetical protein
MVQRELSTGKHIETENKQGLSIIQQIRQPNNQTFSKCRPPHRIQDSYGAQDSS